MVHVLGCTFHLERHSGINPDISRLPALNVRDKSHAWVDENENNRLRLSKCTTSSVLRHCTYTVACAKSDSANARERGWEYTCRSVSLNVESVMPRTDLSRFDVKDSTLRLTD